MAVQVKDIGTAIRIYYERFELSSSDIKQIFGVSGSKTVSRLKNQALELMRDKEKTPWSSGCVNTECAYEAWGLDIKELEKRYQKLMKFFGKKEVAQGEGNSEND